MCNISTEAGRGGGGECGGNTFTICQKEIIAAELGGDQSSSYNMITPQSGRLSSPSYSCISGEYIVPGLTPC